MIESDWQKRELNIIRLELGNERWIWKTEVVKWILN